MSDAESRIGVFKPIDEEAFAPNNPRNMTGMFGSETCRPGVKSGEATLREVTAYMLDHQRFAGVPATALVEMTHPSLISKPISVQQVKSSEYLSLISGMMTF